MNFWIPGEPMPQPRGRAGKTKQGKVYVYNSYSTKAKAWKQSIKTTLLECCRFGFDGWQTSGFCVSLWFQFMRPKSQFIGSKRENSLKECAPELHISKPDVDNLAKLVMDETEDYNDGLYDKLMLDELRINKIYKNDSQVVKLLSMKTWSAEPGCLVSITQVETLEDLLRNTPFDE